MSLPFKLFLTTDTNDSAAPAVDGKAVSGTSTYYSKMFGGNDMAGYDLQVVWTGTPTGTLTLQVSDKANPSEADDTDWVTTTETSMTNPAGSASKFRVYLVGSGGKHRLKYVNASGSGSLYAYAIVSKFHGGNG